MMTTIQPDSTTPAVDTQIPIVAVGGSAGGQEAVTELLSRLPTTTGFAFVYIQHLSASHESHLTNILSRATTMPVVEADNQMPVQPNQVYIIPPNQEMEIQEGRLMLMPRQELMHMPIDRFFISLSERQKAGAIAILLSGMATDGTLGLKAIKVAGGITMAQDQTARYQTMPKAAISEGVVDLVLPPHAMAEELHRLSQRAETLRLTTVGIGDDVNDPDSLLDDLDSLADPELANGIDSEEELGTIIKF
ncbi:MAG TPA: chemotaxis protein CheB, partial [Fibrella sp.]